jgi:probable phosphomutase (TIGR03848 family)
MTTVLLVRHGRTTANATAVLAGWTPGVLLDETGQAQAAKLAERLAVVPLSALVASPLERCQQTSQAVVGVREADLKIQTDERIGECRYGDWTGKPIKELAKDPLWKVVQQHPSAVVFPGVEGEALAATQTRAVAAIREWDARVSDEFGPDAVWMACSHGDVIKAVLADALGLHLDLFQRIIVDPCSVSVIRYTQTRPFVVRMNDTGGDVSALLPPKKRRRKRSAADSDAVVGGGAGDGGGSEATASPAGQ